jgi:hypothetical protein
MTVRVVPLVAVLFSLFFTQGTYLPTLTAQTTTTTVSRTVQNQEGPYSIIEYPAKKEVTVTLSPSALLPEATGHAKVLRTDEGTLVDVSVAFAGKKTEMLEKKGAKYRGWRISDNEFKTCADTVILIEGGIVTQTSETCRRTTIVRDDPKPLNVYAVDDRGIVTALGSLAINNGVGRMTTTTPLTRFMLVLSPEPALTSYDATTRVALRSAVPEGLAVIPITSQSGEKVSAVSTPSGAPTTNTAGTSYSAPMLNIPAYKKGDDTKLRIDFSGALTGARANVFITPRKDGPTEIRVRFHDLKDAPAGKAFILWAVSPENKFVKLGHIVSAAGKNEAEIRAETTLADFALLITMEDASVTGVKAPTGPTVGTFHLLP